MASTGLAANRVGQSCREKWVCARGMDRIVVIEDDPSVQRALKRLLEPEGFSVEVAGDGLAGMAALQGGTATAVILDLRLPGVPGKDVCREIKQQFPSLPVIILSAAADVMDKVLLLELGADDYVTKPFSPRELLARVRAAVRRTNRTEAQDVFSFADISIDFAKMEITRGGQPVSLTAQ